MSGLGEFRGQASQGGSQGVAAHHTQFRSQRAREADEMPGHVVGFIGSHPQRGDSVVVLQQLEMAFRDPVFQDL